MTNRLTQFREKHADRAARWDRIIAPMLGQSGREEGRFARDALDLVQARLLAAVYGDPDPADEIPVPATSVTVP